MPIFEKVLCRNTSCLHNVNYICDFYGQKDKARTLCPTHKIVDEIPLFLLKRREQTKIFKKNKKRKKEKRVKRF